MGTQLASTDRQTEEIPVASPKKRTDWKRAVRAWKAAAKRHRSARRNLLHDLGTRLNAQPTRLSVLIAIQRLQSHHTLVGQELAASQRECTRLTIANTVYKQLLDEIVNTDLDARELGAMAHAAAEWQRKARAAVRDINKGQG